MAETDEFRSEIDSLRADIDNLRQDLRRLADSARQQGASKVATFKQQLQEGAMNRMSQLRDVLDSAKGYGLKACTKAQRKVEDRPFASVLTAFVVGLVVGKLLMRR